MIDDRAPPSDLLVTTLQDKEGKKLQYPTAPFPVPRNTSLVIFHTLQV